MQKKAFVVINVLGMLLFLGACNLFQLPTAVEVKADKFELGVPTKTGNLNIVNLLHHFLSDTFDKNGIELYDMKNYTNSQAFVVGYTMNLLPDFDPDTYLQQIKDQMANIDNLNPDAIDPIYPDPIKIPSLSWEYDTGAPYEFYLGDLFDAMKDTINQNSMPAARQTFTDVPLVNGVSIPPGTIKLPDLSDFMVWDELRNQNNFDMVKVKSGLLSLQISLESGNMSDLNGLSITMSGITLIADGTSNNIGTPVTPPQPYPLTIVLNSLNSFSDLIEIDLAGVEIDKDHPPIFTMSDSISASYTGSGTIISPVYATFSLVIQPKLQNIELNGATNLRIGTMSPDLPDDIKNYIETDNFDFSSLTDSGFLNLKIGSPSASSPAPGGTITIQTDITPKDLTSYFTGLLLDYRLVLKQDDYVYNSVHYSGLNGTTWDIHNDVGSHDLSGVQMNGMPFSVVTKNDFPPGTDLSQVEYSQITISAIDPNNGISFELNGDDYTEMSLPVKIGMAMEINKLEVINWALKNSSGVSLIPDIDPISIDFSNINESSPGAGDGMDISKYVESIKFDYLDLGVDFTVPTPAPTPNPGTDPLVAGDPGLPEALQNKIAIIVTCPDLGFDGTPLKLSAGLNNIHKDNITLYPADAGGNAKTLTITAGIAPVINGIADPTANYFQIGPVELNTDPLVDGGETKLNIYGTVNFDFKWSEVKVNLQNAIEEADPGALAQLSGNFPDVNNSDPSKAEKPIDLYGYAHEYMRGFTLGNVDTLMFVGGPKGLIDLLKPELNFSVNYSKRINPEDPDDDNAANWTGETKNMFDGPLTVYNTNDLPKLPGKNSDGDYVYTQPNLSSLGAGISIDNISAIVADMPKDMYFSYQMALPTEFTVTPDMFDNVDAGDKGISAMIVIMVPLELYGEPGAYISYPNDMMGNFGSQDLFGRKSSDGIHPDMDSVFTDINVKSLGIDISFDKSLFKDATLYLDKNNLLFPNGLNLGSGNTLQFRVNANDWKIIRENMIYPDIKIEFKKGTTIAVPRNPLPTKITITANGSYTMNFKERQD
ncbi:MAG: hypothetical protein FWF29_08990 [Treponema sp.]|nr:hypothetical protein [Treponema sp.]